MRQRKCNSAHNDGAPDGQVASEGRQQEASKHDLLPDGSAHGDHHRVQECCNGVPGHDGLLHMGGVEGRWERQNVEVQLRKTVHKWEHEAAQASLNVPGAFPGHRKPLARKRMEPRKAPVQYPQPHCPFRYVRNETVQRLPSVRQALLAEPRGLGCYGNYPRTNQPKRCKPQKHHLKNCLTRPRNRPRLFLAREPKNHPRPIQLPQSDNPRSNRRLRRRQRLRCITCTTSTTTTTTTTTTITITLVFNKRILLASLRVLVSSTPGPNCWLLPVPNPGSISKHRSTLPQNRKFSDLESGFDRKSPSGGSPQRGGKLRCESSEIQKSFHS